MESRLNGKKTFLTNVLSVFSTLIFYFWKVVFFSGFIHISMIHTEMFFPYNRTVMVMLDLLSPTDLKDKYFHLPLSPCQRWAGTCAARWFYTGPVSVPGIAPTPSHSRTSWPGWPDVCSVSPRHWVSWRSDPSPPIGSFRHSTGLQQSSSPVEGQRTECWVGWGKTSHDFKWHITPGITDEQDIYLTMVSRCLIDCYLFFGITYIANLPSITQYITDFF